MGNLLHPSETGPLIEAAAQAAVAGRSNVEPFKWDEPTHISVEFNRAEEADFCSKLITINRVDAYTVEGRYSTYQEAHRVVWNLMAMSAQGIASQH